MDISKLDVELNALDFYEIDHNGEPTGIRHPDPLKLRQKQLIVRDLIFIAFMSIL
jgi:hypothetical protein